MFQIQSGDLLGVGKIKSLSASHTLAVRLNDLQAKISQIFGELELGGDDVLVCEAQTTMRDPRAAFVVEQVRGIFETLGRDRAVTVPGRLNPRSVQYEILRMGGKQACRLAVKEAAVVTALQLYGRALGALGFSADAKNLKRNQDIVDALLLGTLALSRVNSAARSGQDLEEIFDQRTVSERRARKKVGVSVI